MKLKDIYGNYIAGKPNVMNVVLPNITPKSFIEKDPKSVELERSVNEKMQKAIDGVVPQQTKKVFNPPHKTRIVSYEEAIKELANTLKLTDNKS
jgi:hypothetical protein